MSAIVTTYDNTVYALDPSLYAAASSTAGGEGEFEELLSSQLSDGQMPGTSPYVYTTTSEDLLALNSYDAGQVTAYALSQSSEETASTNEDGATEETTASTTSTSESSEETAESEGSEETAAADGTGWPGDGETMSAWTPSGMQFYDELTGTWVNDDIPHRLNEDGDLEYYWEGQWYLDTAVRHRMTDEETESEVASVDETTTEETSGETAEETSASLESDGPFEVEYYYNTALAEWKIFNFPTRDNEDGTREYYWQDQWWIDSWNHDYTAAETAVA